MMYKAVAKHASRQKQKTTTSRESKTMLKITKVALLLALALSATACVPTTQRAPSMLDYSYVPPQYAKGCAATYGLEDF